MDKLRQALRGKNYCRWKDSAHMRGENSEKIFRILCLTPAYNQGTNTQGLLKTSTVFTTSTCQKDKFSPTKGLLSGQGNGSRPTAWTKSEKSEKFISKK